MHAKFRVILEVTQSTRLASLSPKVDLFSLAVVDLKRLRETETSTTNTSADYRVGPIGIEWLDRKKKMQTDDDFEGVTEVTFLSGHAELPSGVVHLFRPQKDSSLHCGDLVCVLAVPSYMSTADFLQFLGVHQASILNMRMIRNAISKRFMVLIKFKDPTDAATFREEYDRKTFSSLEPEACHVVFVDRVEFKSPSEMSVFAKEEGLLELPTCPVCLERMDANVSGVMGLVCNHTFHCKCLEKWGDSSCPVCRYGSKPAEETSNECATCGAHDDLWMCLICGHIGCGRYGGAHAASHFLAFSHPYAMELQTQRVWDYVGDGYVHRLITNKSDGKLVELPGQNDPADAEQQARYTVDGKIEALALEFGNLLTTQLESQRLFFQHQLAQTEETFVGRVASLEQRVQDLSAKHAAAVVELDATKEQLDAANKEKAKVDKKFTMVSEKYQKLLHETSEERAMHSSLFENYRLLKQQDQEKAVQLTELQDQLRDVMFYIETQQRVENSPHKDEIQEGQVLVKETDSPKRSSSSSSSRRVKK